jgi:hypothetical protein
MRKHVAFVSVSIMIITFGCVTTEKITYTKLDKPYIVEATRNYLPKDVSMQPAYTIYEGSKWECRYKTEKGDSVCCFHEPYSSMSPWKYCLIVDKNQNGFAFIELGSNEFLNWSEGKQPLFKKIE